MNWLLSRPGRTIALAVLLAGGVALAVRGRGLDAQPPAAPAPDGILVARGKVVYEAKCVECHGDTGRGDGPAALLMTPRPLDFTSGKYKIRSTDTGSVPTDDDLIRSVREGLYGLAMPGWQGVLSDDDIAAVVSYLKTLSPKFQTPPQPVTLGPEVLESPESIARGRLVYDKLQCSGCHGTDGHGTDAIATEFEDDWGQPLNAADLTEPWMFHGGASTREVYLRFRTGMSGTPMPSFTDSASDGEMWDLANYVLSLARKPAWQMNADEIKGLYARQAAEAKKDPVRRGRYLVNGMACALCHSPADEQKRILPGMLMAGGLRLRLEPFGDYPTGNLTSDKETGLGNWTDDQIKRVLTTGTLPDGTRMLPYPMDWPSVLDAAPGGSRRDRRVSSHRAARLQQGAQAPARHPAALPVGQVQDAHAQRGPAYRLLSGQCRDDPEGSSAMSTIVKRTAVVLSSLAILAFLAFLYFIPPFFIAPPEAFSKDVAPNTPGVNDITDPVERALAERGRYLVMTTGCIGCHGTPGPQGPDWSRYLAGGLKIQTRHGTFVSRNLTPDRETGIGGRTDAEIVRVLRSGLFPDGHVTSHTVMPWANFSNWTEEDLRAVVVYLRHLKPVHHRIPDRTSAPAVTVPGAVDQDYGGRDYGSSK